VQTNQKLSYRFGLDLLFTNGHLPQTTVFVDNYKPASAAQREAKAYQEKWLTSMKGKELSSNQEI
jgi:hypothetical protein